LETGATFPVGLVSNRTKKRAASASLRDKQLPVFKKHKPKKADSPTYLRPYADAARAHGTGFGTMLWRSPDGQKKRFEVIAQMIDQDRCICADLGCGRADLLTYLADTSRVPDGYFGVDGIPDMFDAGQTVIRDLAIKNACCILADFVADSTLFQTLAADHRVNTFIFSGSLNTLEEPQAKALLDRAYHALPSTGLLIFNFLSDRVPGGDTGETGPAHRFDTLGMLDWAMERTPLVRFRHDYLGGHDATIGMQKP
jgi:SAM-dependent methyltransferase